MSKTRRIISMLIGIFMIVAAVYLMMDPGSGYAVIIFVLGIGLAIKGGQVLWNFFTLSLNSVGSTKLLYNGLLILDLGIFTSCLINVPVIYLMIYLAGIYLFKGVIDILSANDARKLESPHFKVKLAQGLLNVLIAVLCLVFIRRQDIVVYIYGGGIIYNGIIRMVNAFSRTDMVFDDWTEESLEAAKEEK